MMASKPRQHCTSIPALKLNNNATSNGCQSVEKGCGVEEDVVTVKVRGISY